MRKLLVLVTLAGSGLLIHEALENTTLPRADLVIGNGPDPRSLDPAHTSAIADGRVLASLFEGLVVLDPKTSEPRPGVSEAYECSKDGLLWTFHLRDHLRWSDGVPITASDLRWSFLRFLDPATGGRSTDLLYAVEGAKAFATGKTTSDAVAINAPDEKTLKFGLTQRSPTFLLSLALFPMYPVPRHAVSKHGRNWTRPENFVGNGPFRLERWRLKDRVRVVKNNEYWDAASVKAASMDFLSVDSASTLLNLFVSGVADIVTDVPAGSVPTLLQRFGKNGTGEFQPAPRLGTFFFRFNTKSKPFDNEKIRRALATIVDRDSVVNNITRAGEIPATSFVPPDVPCGGVKYEPPTSILVARDERLAGQLLVEGLAEAGIAELPLFEVLYSPEVGDQPIAELLQHRWKSLGVRCRLVLLDSQTLRSRLVKLDYSVARSSWIGDYLDPSTFLDQFQTTSAGNRTGYSNSLYDDLVGRLANIANTDAERATILSRAEAILLESAPIIPIYHYTSRSLVKRGVRGYERNLLDWHPPRSLWLEDAR